MPQAGCKGTCAHGPRNKREKVDRRPPWSTERYKDTRKDTRLMRQIKRCVEVRPSSVHGQGVFATEILPMGRTIAWYRGPIYSCCYLTWDTSRPATYQLELIDGKVIEPSSRKCQHWTKFCNDARGTEYENNLWIGPKGAIETLREIQPGEELFLDYGDAYWQARNK